MKKIVSFICSIVIINLIAFFPNYSYGICNTFNFSKQVSAVKLTLANGHVLHDIRINKNVKDQTVIYEDSFKKLNLLFLIETEDHIYQNRTKLIPFIEKIYDLYGNNSNKITMGIIPFHGNTTSSDFSDEVENIYKNSKEEIIERVNSLERKQNSLETALKMAIEGGELKGNNYRN